MRPSVSISGSGIAASCCARLLRDRSFAVRFESTRLKSSGPTLLLNSQAQALLSDVFGEAEKVVEGGTKVRRRFVLWGKDREVKNYPHSATAIDESALLGLLWKRIPDGVSRLDFSADWEIRSRWGETQSERSCHGSRVVQAVPVEIRAESGDACFVESLEEGWLFLMPSGSCSGRLLAVGGTAERLLDESRLVGKQVLAMGGDAANFAAYPSVADNLCGPGWLACGSAAMSFDPICGEGVGHAAREAILASAVIQEAVRDPAMAGAALSHYSERLLSGFLRHLELCLKFYMSARRGEWWDREIAELEQGIQRAQVRVAQFAKPKYCLAGFDLAALNPKLRAAG